MSSLAYTFFVFYNWSTKKTELTVFSKTELKPKPNWTRSFSQNITETKLNLKNPFRTSLLTAMCNISKWRRNYSDMKHLHTYINVN